jgi:hypothetical protein
MRASRIIAHRQQREREEQRDRDQVIAEFGADPQRLADEILRHRGVLKNLAQALAWAAQGEPFGLIAPGPHLGLYRRPRAAGVACESDGEQADDH